MNTYYYKKFIVFGGGGEFTSLAGVGEASPVPPSLDETVVKTVHNYKLSI